MEFKSSIIVKVNFENNDYAITNFTGNLEEAKEFYIGRSYNFLVVSSVEKIG